MLPLRDNIRTRRFPLVTATLIAINAAVWLGYELGHVNAAVRELGFYPCSVEGACQSPESWPVAVLTSMFAHAGWLHIGGNMLFLWIFGNNVEDVLGRLRYALFYLASGVVAIGVQTTVTLALGARLDAEVPYVGASGAIAGVLGAYFLLYPRARVLTVVFILLFFTLVDLPAVVLLGFWFLLQLWEGGFGLFAPGAGGGVAFFAHVGGFVFGALVAWARFRPARPSRVRRPRLPVVSWR